MRGAHRKGVRYFGPYAHAWAIRETLDLLLRVFPARTCSAGVFRRSGQIGRPCLLGYIGKCSAPCVGRVTAEEHREIVDDFCDFMAGKADPMIRRLEKEMAAARPTWTSSGRPGCVTTSAPCAGRWRSRRWCSATAPTPTWSASPRTNCWPRPGVPRPGRPGARPARLDRGRGRRAPGRSAGAWWRTSCCSSTATGGATTAATPRCPGRSWCRCCPAGRRTARANWPLAAGCAARGCPCGSPQRGDKRALAETVARNAQEALTRHRLKRAGDLTARSAALTELAETLGMDVAPLRIECIDISHVRAPTWSPPWWCSRTACPSAVRLPAVRDPGPARRRRRLDRRGGSPAVQPTTSAAARAATNRPRTDRATSTPRGAGRPTRCSPAGIDPETGRPAGSPTHRSCWWSTAARRR